jgi:DNA-binding SARP family transcriptional activator
MSLTVDARAELLPGWYDDWVIFERERLRQLRLHALDALAGRLTAQARYAEALEAAIECARMEPLRETSNRLIIAIHLAEDNVAEAVRHYEFFRDLLRVELGIEPSARLAGLLPAQRPKPVRVAAGDRYAQRSPVGSMLIS